MDMSVSKPLATLSSADYIIGQSKNNDKKNKKILLCIKNGLYQLNKCITHRMSLKHKIGFTINICDSQINEYFNLLLKQITDRNEM